MFVRRRKVLSGLLGGGLGALGAVPPAFSQTPSSGNATPSRPPAGAQGRSVFGSGPTRIALMIESQSEDFGPAARAVIGGVRAALQVEAPGHSVEVMPLGDRDESLPKLVDEIGRRGFSLALGPLTRDNVNALADLGALPVPVLALNLPDVDRRVPFNLVFFSLAIEGESRQVADEAFREAASRNAARRAPQAVLVGQGSSLSRRGLTAFAQRWGELGGVVAETIEIDTGDAVDWRAALAAARPDVAFTVVSPDDLRLVRAALRPDVPLFGTSQLNAVQANVVNRGAELDGIRLVDMPWQLDPAAPRIAAYPREKSLKHLDFQRLYALGVDAYRLGLPLLRGETRFELDGVTGWLRVDLQRDLRVERQAMPAEFRGGQVVPSRGGAR